jgi:hypothetical protein
MNRKLWALLFSALLLGALIPEARADAGNKEVIFKINGPVEVPGRILNAGRYDLKLVADGDSLAQLWNATGTKFYGFYETIPVDRSRVTDHARIKLAESSSRAPERISAWFYPGDIQGNKLLYAANTAPANESCACTPHLLTR